MRYATLAALLLASASAFARPNLLADLTAQLERSAVLPVGVIQQAPTRAKITFLPPGALARWNPKTDTFEISKTHWKKAPHMECLLPLLAHESMHAYLAKQARTQGFAWPVTLQDEALAHYYQLQAEKTLPDYAARCHSWQPQLTDERQALAQQNWPAFEMAVYMRYSQFEDKNLPPPPLTNPWASSNAKTLSFYYHTYRCARTLAAQRLWQKGGNWACVRPQERAPLLQSEYYLAYQQLLQEVMPKL